MRNFIRLCDIARLQGKFTEDLEIKNKETGRSTNGFVWNNTPDWFHNYLSQAQPFVFDYTPVEFTINDVFRNENEFNEWKDSSGKVETVFEAKGDFDLPFPIITIEFLNSQSFSIGTKHDDEILKERFIDALLQSNSNLSYSQAEESYNSIPKQSYPVCLIVEKAPKVYIGYILSTNENNSTALSRIYAIDDKVVTHILRNYLPLINSNEVGVEIVNKKIKIGSGQSKHIRNINKVIHITPKQNRDKYYINGRKIEFSHRFLVRGHWRKISEHSLGKNRAGEYSIAGMTWVTEFQKGDKELPLIKKVRLVA